MTPTFDEMLQGEVQVVLLDLETTRLIKRDSPTPKIVEMSAMNLANPNQTFNTC